MCKRPERGGQRGTECCCNVDSKALELKLVRVELLMIGFSSLWDRNPLEDAEQSLILEQSRLKKNEQGQEPSGGGYCNPAA